ESAAPGAHVPAALLAVPVAVPPVAPPLPALFPAAAARHWFLPDHPLSQAYPDDARLSKVNEIAQLSQPIQVVEAPVRPPRGFKRLFIAYVTTLRVVASYLSLRLQMRFRSPSAANELLRRKNLLNARRIHRAIARLQGLFIKVGQLISIMTNFLPPEFRTE